MTTPCIEWRGPKLKTGYGTTRLPGRPGPALAHRVAYCQANGIDPLTLPSDVIIRHHCDNPSCVNPEHLVAGTVQDNIDDKMRRGRHRFGCKLCPEQVEQIREALARGELQREIARRFDISQPAVSNIATGYRWGAK